MVAVQQVAYSSFGDEQNRAMRNQKCLRKFAQDALERRTVLYDHAPLAGLVPDGVLRFTMLRRPRPRLVSHIKDWRRFPERQIETFPPQKREAATRVQTQSVSEFISYILSTSSPVRLFFDNYMVRAIAENRIGHLAQDTENAEMLLPIAMDVLSKEFEIVGILEQEEQTRRRLAKLMNWVAPFDLPRLNQTTEDSALSVEIKEAAPMLAKATEHDERLYQHALHLFETRIATR